jgi:hypothetical protein
MTPYEIVYIFLELQSTACYESAMNDNNIVVQNMRTYASFDVWMTIAFSHQEST